MMSYYSAEDSADEDAAYRNRPRTKSRAETFPNKLNDNLRYQICFRIALGYTTRMVIGWLVKVHNISVTYQGLRKYWKRKRWVKVTTIIRTQITERPEIREMIQGMLEGWLKQEVRIFDNYAGEVLSFLKNVHANEPDRAAKYRMVSLELVQKFNEAMQTADKVIKGLSVQTSLKSTYS